MRNLLLFGYPLLFMALFHAMIFGKPKWDEAMIWLEELRILIRQLSNEINHQKKIFSNPEEPHVMTWAEQPIGPLPKDTKLIIYLDRLKASNA